MRSTFGLLIAMLIGLGAAGGAWADEEHGHGHGEAAEEHHDEAPKGPHRGAILRGDGLSLELSIFEKGTPPRFRVYPTSDDTPVPPEEVRCTIALERFGGRVDKFELSPHDGYLTSEKIVEEPHSFDAVVDATYRGKEYHWSHPSYEGRTVLTDEGLRVADLEISTAGPAEIHDTVKVYGRLLANEDRVAHVMPRFPGIVREIRKTLGDRVEKGDVLAVIESNQGLQPYEIRSQLPGLIVKRHASPGEFVSDAREIFVVADLSEVWADFQVYRDDFGTIPAGHKISVDLGNGSEVEATVTYMAPIIDEATQSRLVRAVLPNPSGALRPGLFVTGELSTARATVPLAVRREAVQTFRDWKVVFLTDGHTFQAMPVTLGRSDSAHVEVLSGLTAGDRYVSKNSFIIKADIEKSGASHDH